MIIPTSELLTDNIADRSSSDKSALISPLSSLRPVVSIYTASSTSLAKDCSAGAMPSASSSSPPSSRGKI